MNAMQVMQKGVPLSPSTIWTTENAFRLVAVNHCNASKQFTGWLLTAVCSVHYVPHGEKWNTVLLLCHNLLLECCFIASYSYLDSHALLNVSASLWLQYLPLISCYRY